MTCIIAINHDGKIFFGSDSSCSDDEAMSTMMAPKIFKKGSELVGFCGDIRIGQILRSGWSFPKKNNESLAKYIHLTIPKSISRLLAASGCLKKEDDLESMDANLLFTFNDQIYIMEGNFAVWQSQANYSSIGSGSDFAMGSLFSTEEWDVTGPIRMDLALKASERYCQSVSSPFTYLNKAL